MKMMHRGTLVIDRDSDMRGMIAGDLIIRPGCDVTVAGMVSGDVIIEQGARVRITGMVSGSVIEAGGIAVVSGMVAGR